MKKENFRIHYLVATFVIIIVFVFTFLPLIPIWTYGGTIEGEIYPFYTFKYYTFAAQLFSLLKNDVFISKFYAFAFIFFYIGEISSIILFLCYKYKIGNIVLSVSSFLILFGTFLGTYLLLFSIIVFVVLQITVISLSIIDKFFTKEKRESRRMIKNQKELGKKIKERRIQLHLTQTQLADKIFVSRTLITKIESGSVKLSEENLTLLEQTLGIKLH